VLPAATPPTLAGDPSVSLLVPPAIMHAVEGISFGNDGMLYGTSIHGQSVYRIDPRSGRVTIAVGAPAGEADDVAIGPPGTPVAGVLAWTAQRTGEIRIERPGGGPEVAMRNVPRVNPIAFSADGRLFMAQLGADGDPLWELDLIGGRAPRQVARDHRLNGFGFGPDGRLYAPLFGTDHLVAIDVNTGAFTTVASGVGAPSAVKNDGQGHLYSVDYLKGDVWRTELSSGESRRVGSLPAPLDNLAISPDGLIYLSSAADSRIVALDPLAGTQREVVAGWFTIPLGMSLTRLDGREVLLVADPFGYRYVDTRTGEVVRPPWQANRGASSAIAADERYIALDQTPSSRIRLIDRQTDQVVFDSTALKSPRGLLLTREGSVLVVDASAGSLFRVTATGAELLASGLDRPVGLAFDGPGAVVVTEYTTGTLQRIDLQTGALRPLAQGIEHPTGLARLRDGRWAVIEPDRGRVIAVDPRTGTRTVLARGLALALDGLDLPSDANSGVAVGGDGAIFVSCPGNNSIVKIAPPGRGRSAGSPSGPKPSGDKGRS
jgi:sugar lactone lactonase YvrE